MRYVLLGFVMCVCGCSQPNNRQLAEADIHTRVARAYRDHFQAPRSMRPVVPVIREEIRWTIKDGKTIHSYVHDIAGGAVLVDAAYSPTNGLTLTFDRPPRVTEHDPLRVFMLYDDGNLYEAAACFQQAGASLRTDGVYLRLPVTLTGSEEPCDSFEVLPREQAFEQVSLPTVAGRVRVEIGSR